MGNYDLNPDETFKPLLDLPIYMGYPGQEYHYLPAMMRQVITVIRLSLGDFDFGEATNLS